MFTVFNSFGTEIMFVDIVTYKQATERCAMAASSCGLELNEDYRNSGSGGPINILPAAPFEE